MEADPQNFFTKLSEFSKDTKGLHECERLLRSLNSSLTDEQFDKSYLGKYWHRHLALISSLIL